MARPRTLMATAAVVLLSIGVARIRGVTVTGQTASTSVPVSIDGQPETLTISLPAAAVDHLQGTVGVRLLLPAGHFAAVSAGQSPSFNVEVAAETSDTSDGAITATTLVKTDSPVTVQISFAEAAGHTDTFSGPSNSPLVVRFGLPGTALTAQVH